MLISILVAMKITAVYKLRYTCRKVINMRNLTIKRTKCFVGCLAKMKIYIEDPQSGDTVISGTPCRKIGELKNGEEKTFQIGEQSTKIFAIADKISKNYCNEYIELPEGNEDIYLSGQNKFNLANGNAFRFDNNESAEVQAHRKSSNKKGLKIFITILAVAVVVGLLAGFCAARLINSGNTDKPVKAATTFSSEGMNITLPDEFEEVKVGTYTAAYDSEDVAVFALRESFNLIVGSENYSLRQYAQSVIDVNNLGSAEITESDGLTHFEYENKTNGGSFKYIAYVYKTDDAFWLIQFAATDKNVEKYADQITEWAKSVTFDK